MACAMQRPAASPEATARSASTHDPGAGTLGPSYRQMRRSDKTSKVPAQVPNRTKLTTKMACPARHESSQKPPCIAKHCQEGTKLKGSARPQLRRGRRRPVLQGTAGWSETGGKSEK